MYKSSGVNRTGPEQRSRHRESGRGNGVSGGEM